MLVMHVLNSRQYSGAENVAITIINSMREQIDSIYVSPQGPIKDYLEENNIRYFPVNKLSRSELVRAIKTNKPDIIHAHDFTAGIITAITGTKIPIINHLHNNPPWIKHYNLRSFVYALSCFRYDKILTVSDSVMNEYVFGKLLKKKTEIIGNPIDLERIRRLAGNQQKRYDIAFLGRLTLQKNPYLFLDIIADLKQYKPDISAIMIGDGELKVEVKKKIKELGLESNVEMLGFQKNPYIFLNQSKILLMPSSWEGFGLAAVEALALGLPVICSGVGGLSNIVNKECGAICNEYYYYIENIMTLFDNEEQIKKMSANAVCRANLLSSLDDYTNKLLKIYSEVFVGVW